MDGFPFLLATFTCECLIPTGQNKLITSEDK